MPVGGAKPKEDRSQIRHRVPPVHEWTEVERIPFDGPALPPRQRTVSVDDPDADDDGALAAVGEWPRRTLEWWEAVRKMPHAALWEDTDWQYAFDVAETHARFVGGWKGCNGAEVRMREKLLGTTADARRDLRIRYIDPKPATVAGQLPADVARLDDYRSL